MKFFLYGLNDFQNICTISRSLEFFGENECFIYDNNNLIREKYGKSYSRKLKGISAGAFEKINFLKVDNPIDFLKNHTGRKIATVLSSTSESIFNFQFFENDLVLFGAEFRGLPNEIIDLCDMHITIPGSGLTQSLNVSHALTIILYESKRTFF